MHVGNAGILLIDCQHHVFLHHFPVSLAGHGVNRNLPQIACSDQFVERLRRLLFVERVLRDHGP